ncbi:MAG: 3-beta hydroxysteroid dehydrogenase [Myxococcales bacterium]|nr:3-beta hydroxysteroid dehydrogenase [Myxococcales bacterium]
MKILVTGGGGFLGRAILAQLPQVYPQAERHTLQRSDHPDLTQKGITQHLGPLTDANLVDQAVAGSDLVFHVAAKAGVWGSYDSFHGPNVQGTENILAACRKHGVKKLIYTSTPSVVHSGSSLEGVDESVPYADHFSTHYPATKAQAEKMVLAANDDKLSTVALRPHLIWGPGDNHLVPRIVDRARRGRLRIVGPGDNLIDGVFIDNAAQAHVLASQKLQPNAACAGKAYFITQGEPVATKELINGIVQAAGLPKVEKSISPKAAYMVGFILEMIFKTFGIQKEPPMTRFVAEQLATAHWYNIDAAKNDLGYDPKVSTAQGLALLKASFQD